MQKKIEIDEEAIIASMAPDWSRNKSVRAKVNNPNPWDELDEPSAHTPTTEPSETPTPTEPPMQSADTNDVLTTNDIADTRRTPKQRRCELDEYRRRYMQTPRIDDRKPVFISRTTRNRLDRIVRLLGERGMSVSGLVENLSRHHLAAHESDIECWRKL